MKQITGMPAPAEPIFSLSLATYDFYVYYLTQKQGICVENPIPGITISVGGNIEQTTGMLVNPGLDYELIVDYGLQNQSLGI